MATKGVPVPISMAWFSRENFNRKPPYFMGKSMVSGYDFPLNQSIDQWANPYIIHITIVDPYIIPYITHIPLIKPWEYPIANFCSLKPPNSQPEPGLTSRSLPETLMLTQPPWENRNRAMIRCGASKTGRCGPGRRPNGR